jgi:hypothetical protein
VSRACVFFHRCARPWRVAAGFEARLAARALLIWLVALALGACVGPQIQPRGEALARMREVFIVAMEVRPLSVDASYVATGPASIVHFLPRYNIGLARSVGVLSGIVLMLELPDKAAREVVYPPSLQSQIDPAASWPLSVELAREIERLLVAAGRGASLSAQIKPIPGVQNRGRTVFLENWMAPIRSWYNDASPSAQYDALAAKGIAAVIEVGVSNYEIYAEKLLLQVSVKLLDPASGALLGRARASSFTALPPMDAAFAADAGLFKQAVLSAGKPLVLNCLQELGLVPK